MKLDWPIRANTNLASISKSIRKTVLELTYKTKSPHIGSCFSCVEIITALYFQVFFQVLSSRFILSKGHACLTLYSVLEKRGILPSDVLKRYGIDNGLLEHHPKLNRDWGIEVTSGSLGHGLSLGCGLAQGAKLKKTNFRTFVLLSDGELNEGSTWEALMYAPQNKLNNLTAIIDYNKIQALGFTNEIIDLDPLADKMKAFGWHVIEIDGHDYSQIISALTSTHEQYPTVVIAHTIKGKGVSFMENQLLWHYRCPDEGEFHQAMNEINNF